jgi:uncharacterized membrane protein YfcA
VSGIDLGVVCVVILATGWVQATAGFGFALLTVPLLLLRLGLSEAVVISTLVGTIGNLGHSLHSRADLDKRLTRRFLLCTVLGGPLGVYLLFSVDARWLKLVLGVSILFGVIALHRGFDGVRKGSWFDWLFALVSGVLNTATSTNGPPLVFVLQARRIQPAAFRATLNTVFLFSGLYAGALYAFNGKITADLLLASALSLPMLLVGSIVGVRMRSRINEATFRKGVLLLLSLSGVSTILSAL